MNSASFAGFRNDDSQRQDAIRPAETRHMWDVCSLSGRGPGVLVDGLAEVGCRVEREEVVVWIGLTFEGTERRWVDSQDSDFVAAAEAPEQVALAVVDQVGVCLVSHSAGGSDV